jgi:hypothetical protein
MAPSGQINSHHVVTPSESGSSTTLSTVTDNVNKESHREYLVNASESVICLDDEIEHVNKANEINLLSKDCISNCVAVNQEPPRLQSLHQTHRQPGRTEVNNK